MREQTGPEIQIEQMLSYVPSSATLLRVSAKSLGMLQTVIERTREECEQMDRKELAQHVLKATEQWTDSQQRETVFLIQWITDTDRPVSTLPFRVSPANGTMAGLPPIDGSFESLLAGMQAASQAKDKLMIEQLRAMTELFIRMVESLQGRLEVSDHRDQENRELKQVLLEAQSIDDATFNDRFDKFMTFITPLLQAKIQKDGN